MNIGIDAKMFTSKKYTGIPWYVHEVLREWSEKYPEHQYFLMTRSPIELNFELKDNWHVVVKKPFYKMGKFWTTFQLPGMIKENNIDVFWGTNYSLPPIRTGTRYYVSIYDLAILKLKGIGDTVNEIKMRTMTKPACIDADKIFTISQSSANDIVDIFGIPRDKIEICYCGGLPATENYEKNNKYENVRQELRDIKDYFLFIGTIEPRKNLTTLIRAFEKYVDETKSETYLVLAGNKGWKCDDVYQMYESSPYKDKIIMPGFISSEEKNYLLEHAGAFVYPSLYEGFGIPILEAFQYGIPTVTTNVSSLPEVGGNAAFYIHDVHNYNELCGKMKEVMALSDYEKNELVKSMKERLDVFSWEKTAKSMMDVITERRK